MGNVCEQAVHRRADPNGNKHAKVNFTGSREVES